MAGSVLSYITTLVGLRLEGATEKFQARCREDPKGVVLEVLGKEMLRNERAAEQITGIAGVLSAVAGNQQKMFTATRSGPLMAVEIAYLSEMWLLIWELTQERKGAEMSDDCRTAIDNFQDKMRDLMEEQRRWAKCLNDLKKNPAEVMGTGLDIWAGASQSEPAGDPCANYRGSVIVAQENVAKAIRDMKLLCNMD
ncbi:hypothetical protein SAMN05421538_106138 [Paracoccus isoporae]|uniref:Uncharacterized protein n=1 Tax=Paracoccus isoporae TaxID=591205 RepID=A0A1G7CN77_9RHOB|nr:hypothetical protein [Paracoccus isoporae]SDE40126.1 hypothetical protein SAMN05421538_106138 [Paracoccus isoporae]